MRKENLTWIQQYDLILGEEPMRRITIPSLIQKWVLTSTAKHQYFKFSDSKKDLKKKQKQKQTITHGWHILSGTLSNRLHRIIPMYPSNKTAVIPESLKVSSQKKVQKQFSRGALRKGCSENMQQIYRRTPMLESDFNKVAEQPY